MKQAPTDPAKGTGDMREVERAAEAGHPRALIALEAHRNEPISIEVSAHHVHLTQEHVERFSTLSIKGRSIQSQD